MSRKNHDDANEKCHFSVTIQYVIWNVHAIEKPDEATVCMLNNDLESFLIETLWILRARLDNTVAEMYFAPVSLYWKCLHLFFFGKRKDNLQYRIYNVDATSSASTSQQWC